MEGGGAEEARSSPRRGTNRLSVEHVVFTGNTLGDEIESRTGSHGSDAEEEKESGHADVFQVPAPPTTHPSQLSNQRNRHSVFQARTQVLPDFFHDVVVLGFPVLLAVVAMVAAYAVQLATPVPESASVSFSRFSEERAHEYVREVCKESRGLNDPHNNATRHFILSSLYAIQESQADSFRRDLLLEISPNLTFTSSVQPVETLGDGRGVQVLLTPGSVVARVCAVRKADGHCLTSASSPAVLVANFDTPALSEAVSSGAFVGALIEVVRNVMHGTGTVVNHLVFAFVNAAEVDNAGLEAIVQSHPWVAPTSPYVVLWGGGVGTKEVMFQATNLALLRLYAANAHHPHTNVVLRTRANRGLVRHHELTPPSVSITLSQLDHRVTAGTSSDTFASLHTGSLQHVGSNALALALALASTDTNWRSAMEHDVGDYDVYFDLMGWYCVVLHRPVYIAVTAGLIAASALYLVVRVRAGEESVWHAHVGPVDNRVAATALGVVVLTLLSAFLAVTIVGGLLSFATVVLYTHPTTTAAVMGAFAVLLISVVQIVVQNTLPVALRVGADRWCHHLHLATLAFYVVVTTVGLVVLKGEGYSIGLWLFSALVRLLIDHALRILPQTSQAHITHHSIDFRASHSSLQQLLLSSPSTPSPSSQLPEDEEEEEEGGEPGRSQSHRSSLKRGLQSSYSVWDSAPRSSRRSRPRSSAALVEEQGTLCGVPRRTQIKALYLTVVCVRVFFCLLIPCVVQMQLATYVGGMLQSYLRDTLLWGMVTVVLFAPVVLALLPDLHCVRHIRFVGFGTLVAAAALSLVLLFSTDFSPAFPDVVQMHHTEQVRNVDPIQRSSYAYLQATDMGKIKNQPFPFDDCEYSSAGGSSRCFVRLDTSDYLHVPQPTPTVSFSAAGLVKTDNTFGVFVVPGSNLFALDFRNLELAGLRWYGKCVLTDNATWPIPTPHGNVRCDNTTLVHDPVAIELGLATLVADVEGAQSAFYLEGDGELASVLPPLKLMTFFTRAGVSPLIQNFQVGLPSWISLRNTFFGAAHMEGYWYFVANGPT